MPSPRYSQPPRSILTLLSRSSRAQDWLSVTSRYLVDQALDPPTLKVFELHEAFAGQVLANLKALDSEKFCQTKLGLQQKVVPPVPCSSSRWGPCLWSTSTPGEALCPSAIPSVPQVRERWSRDGKDRWSREGEDRCSKEGEDIRSKEGEDISSKEREDR